LDAKKHFSGAGTVLTFSITMPNMVGLNFACHWGKKKFNVFCLSVTLLDGRDELMQGSQLP